MAMKCSRCGGAMEAGFTTALGLHGSELERLRQVSSLLFVVKGTPTRLNPLRALQQGLADEPADRAYRIEGARCATCGALDFFALAEHTA